MSAFQKRLPRNRGPGPIVSANHREPFLVGDAFVREIDETYHMWYIFGTNWKRDKNGTPQRKYKIAHATSKDLISWDRNGALCFPNEDEKICEALPSICSFNGQYHMVYCSRNQFDFRSKASSGNNYRLRHAVSEDLITWQNIPESFEEFYSGFDEEMQCYPYVFTSKEKMWVIYNGNQFGLQDFGLLEWG